MHETRLPNSYVLRHIHQVGTGQSVSTAELDHGDQGAAAVCVNAHRLASGRLNKVTMLKTKSTVAQDTVRALA